ncbi:MAG: N-acetylmuramic acid 6-phosphate etherase [Clostridiales bacterium]|nr:N-acetylmuramic acid 6-phosphate etherase [Clostridiales bacterium]
MIKLNQIDTEQVNPHTLEIDRVPTLDMLRMINDEDHLVADAVERVLPSVAVAIERIVEQMDKGGRLVYCGCGTSGRLGVLDAAECPPTFGTDPGLVVGLIAGGEAAFTRAIEGAEDDYGQGRVDLEKIGFCADDALVGIAASGRTPYVLGAIDYARSLGAPAIALTCSANSELSRHADVAITPLPGPEVITGSTRLKSGTAQKMVLNMLSTGVMIKRGKVYGNLMVDVKATNEKLCERAVSIVMRTTGTDDATARQTLAQCGFSCKIAIVMLLCGLDAKQAGEALDAAGGHISQTVKNCAIPE